MKLRLLTVFLFAAVLSGCKYSNLVDVELQTNSKGRLASAKLVKPSDDLKFNKLAVEAAKRRFPIRVRDPKPNHTYNQPVSITYPLFRTVDPDS